MGPARAGSVRRAPARRSAARAASPSLRRCVRAGSRHPTAHGRSRARTGSRAVAPPRAGRSGRACGVEKIVASIPASDAPRATATPRRNASLSGAAGMRIVRPRIVWSRSAANVSPVMKVWKRSMRRPSTIAHFACEPGRPTSVVGAPACAVAARRIEHRAEDLRFLAAHHIGQRAAFDHARHDAQRHAARGPHFGERRGQPVRIGRGCRCNAPSTQPCALPTIPHAISGRPGCASSQSPQAASKAVSKPPSAGGARQLHDPPGQAARADPPCPAGPNR